MQALGGPVGRVPGAQVGIQRSGESSVRFASTDSLGLVTFADVLPGRYRVTSLRLLDRGETRVVAAAHAHLAGINALGGGGLATVQPPAATAEVEAVAGRRGSLVISEVHDWSPVVDFGPATSILAGQYVEVYNNADTTVYLDGKILASAFWYVWESSLDETSLDNCEEFRRWRLDPEGVWSEWHLRFPGSGREYALNSRSSPSSCDAGDRSPRSGSGTRLPGLCPRLTSKWWAQVRMWTIRPCRTWKMSDFDPR